MNRQSIAQHIVVGVMYTRARMCIPQDTDVHSIVLECSMHIPNWFTVQSLKWYSSFFLGCHATTIATTTTRHKNGNCRCTRK